MKDKGFVNKLYYIHPVQVRRWPSNFTPGIKTKFKDFNGEIQKKIKFAGAS